MRPCEAAEIDGVLLFAVVTNIAPHEYGECRIGLYDENGHVLWFEDIASSSSFNAIWLGSPSATKPDLHAFVFMTTTHEDEPFTTVHVRIFQMRGASLEIDRKWDYKSANTAYQWRIDVSQNTILCSSYDFREESRLLIVASLDGTRTNEYEVEDSKYDAFPSLSEDGHIIAVQRYKRGVLSHLVFLSAADGTEIGSLDVDWKVVNFFMQPDNTFYMFFRNGKMQKYDLLTPAVRVRAFAGVADMPAAARRPVARFVMRDGDTALMDRVFGFMW